MKKGNYYQGVYTVKNTEKYIGNKMPKFRSSWESRLCYYMDNNDNVLRWGYENVIIPYRFSVDGKIHKYIIDFYAEIKDKNGDIKKYLIEVKPLSQTKPPRKPKNKNKKAVKRYLYEQNQYIKNTDKWTTVQNFCKNNNLEFKILTEKTIL